MKYEKYLSGFEKENIGELKRETIDQYKRDLGQFFRWIKNKEIKEETLEDYKIYLRSIDYEVSTINTKLASTSKFLKYLKMIDVIERKIKYIPIKKQSKELTRVPNKTECKKMISRAMRDGNYKDTCLLSIPFFTGVRVSELIKLKKKDFETDGLPNKFLKVEGKGQKERIIVIPRQLYYEYLRPYFMDSKMKSNDYLFKKKNSRKPISRFTVNQIYKKYASKTRVKLEKATPHQFRHAYAIAVLDGSKNIETVRQMLGHGSINTTAIYLNQSKEDQFIEVEESFIEF